ncbi:MAG: rRNA pseudouridine synthase [Clostridia bacterium]|nr:rRNA pseudouridine synthase [Oscillospiraceae bacterium]MBQ7032825.1 rRNA pseudouridine synthase [Clostridia bacterium]
MRINKFIAAAGVCSRRKADELIAQGRVFVNGARVTEPGLDIAENDTVAVDGEKIGAAEKKQYIVLHKPDGFVTTMDDPFGRPTVMDLVTDVPARVFPVGRLDYHTEGLLILTNDGDFANHLMHPRNAIYKTYIAHVPGFPTLGKLAALRRGIQLEDGKTAPCKVTVIRQYPDGVDISISIREGKNRQVRRMIEAIGHKVTRLVRVSVGNVQLGHLPKGKWRHMTPREIEEIVKGR